MKSKLKGWIIGAAVLFVLMIPIISDFYKSKKIEIINYMDFINLTDEESFSLVYYGSTSDQEYSKFEKDLVKLKKDFDVNLKSLDVKSLNETEKNDFIKENKITDSEEGFVFLKEGRIIHIQEGKTSIQDLETLVNKYYNNVIPAEEIAYKVAKNYNEYKKAIDSKKIVMSVFGRSSCSFCNMYEPIYNDAAAEHKLNVYHFDSDVYDKKEFDKIRNAGIKIPKECTSTGKDQTLADPYGTPLTLFTKNGKVIDCISGYVDADGLNAKLKKVGMIK